MRNILAIDPGNIESGVAIVAIDDYKPLACGKYDNESLIGGEYCLLAGMFAEYKPEKIIIEQIGHYGTGMPAGKTVFDTCIWIGRFIQWCIDCQFARPNDITLVLRKHYVAELTGSPKAKDANIIQYLIDRFAPDAPNRGKGTKKSPGWFYGFHADMWQCYALGVYYVDLIKKIEFF